MTHYVMSPLFYLYPVAFPENYLSVISSILLMFMSTMFHYLYTVEYDYVPPPTEVPHHCGNLLSAAADPLTTENSSYGLGDNEEKEDFSKCM